MSSVDSHDGTPNIETLRADLVSALAQLDDAVRALARVQPTEEEKPALIEAMTQAEDLIRIIEQMRRQLNGQREVEGYRAESLTAQNDEPRTEIIRKFQLQRQVQIESTRLRQHSFLPGDSNLNSDTILGAVPTNKLQCDAVGTHANMLIVCPAGSSDIELFRHLKDLPGIRVRTNWRFRHWLRGRNQKTSKHRVALMESSMELDEGEFDDDDFELEMPHPRDHAPHDYRELAEANESPIRNFTRREDGSYISLDERVEAIQKSVEGGLDFALFIHFVLREIYKHRNLEKKCSSRFKKGEFFILDESSYGNYILCANVGKSSSRDVFKVNFRAFPKGLDVSRSRQGYYYLPTISHAFDSQVSIEKKKGARQLRA